MADTVTLTIDGKKVEAPTGMNLVEAAALAGIHIPNLCHIKGLKGIGACRLCLVEIEGLKRPLTACTTKVRDAMVVHTQTEKVQEIRNFVIELILSMHPLDCMTCTKAGVCRLQAYAYEFGIKESSFTRKASDFPIDETNPFIVRDPNYCVLCGRCVRICKEQGTSVLDFYGRGVGSRVMTPNDRPLQESGCTFCGSCVDTCPVNALVEADKRRKGRQWEYSRHPSVCLFCGNACDIMVSTCNGKVVKVNTGGRDGRADHYICAFGRFGFDSIDAETRVTTPLKRVDGQLQAIDWDEAFKTMAERLNTPGDLGLLSTADLLNEDILAIKRFAQDLGITHLASTVDLYADKSCLLGQPVDIDRADLLVLVGLNPSQWDRIMPALDVTIRRKAHRGTKLVVMHSETTGLCDHAQISVIGDEAAGLAALAKALTERGITAPTALDTHDAVVTESIAALAELYAEAAFPVIVSSPALYGASHNVAILKGKALAMSYEANAKGAALLGPSSSATRYTELTHGTKSVLYAIGALRFRRTSGVKFLIVQHTHLTKLAMEADLVLPATTAYESKGTIVDYMGRVKLLVPAIDPCGQSKMHREILEGVAQTMGLESKPEAVVDMHKEIQAFTPTMLACPFRKRDDLPAGPEDFMLDVSHSVTPESRLCWLEDLKHLSSTG